MTCLLVLGGGLFFLAAGIGWKLLGLWLIVGTALVFALRGDGPIIRGIRGWMRKRSG